MILRHGHVAVAVRSHAVAPSNAGKGSVGEWVQQRHQGLLLKLLVLSQTCSEPFRGAAGTVCCICVE